MQFTAMAIKQGSDTPEQLERERDFLSTTEVRHLENVVRRRRTLRG